MILEGKSTEQVGGYSKKLNHAATSLMLSATQSSLYKFPIPSTVRELTTNGVDSINAKQIALSILSGERKESDFFADVDDLGNVDTQLYEDSKFDASYYDPKHLSADNNVYIHYTEKDEGREVITFSDYGVGLWGQNLLGYFEIGFSNKRLSMTQAGGYGLGAKTPIATDIEYFIVHTYYNGVTASFKVYEFTVIPFTPPFEEDGTVNTKYSFTREGVEDAVPFEFYGKPTNRKNGIVVEIPALRRDRRSYDSSIKEQLGYFTNVVYTRTPTYGDDRVVDLGLKVMYESENIIIPEVGRYTAPHIVLKVGNNYINYGKLDYEMLNRPALHGGYALKLDVNKVDIPPNRESIQYKAKSTNAINGRLALLETEALGYFDKLLSDDMNPLDKYRLLNAVTTRSVFDSVHDVHAIMASFIEDKSKLKGISTNPILATKPVGISFIVINVSRNRWSNNQPVSHTTVKSLTNLTANNVCITTTSIVAAKRKAAMLKESGSIYACIVPKDLESLTEADQTVLALYESAATFMSLEDFDSSSFITSDTIKLSAEEEKAEPVLTAKQMRERDGTISATKYQVSTGYAASIVRTRMNVSLSAEAKNYKYIIYGSAEDHEALQVVSRLHHCDSIIVLKISKPNILKIARLIPSCIHVTNFILKSDMISIDPKIVNSLVADVLRSELAKIEILTKSHHLPSVQNAANAIADFIDDNTRGTFKFDDFYTKTVTQMIKNVITKSAEYGGKRLPSTAGHIIDDSTQLTLAILPPETVLLIAKYQKIRSMYSGRLSTILSLFSNLRGGTEKEKAEKTKLMAFAIRALLKSKEI